MHPRGDLNVPFIDFPASEGVLYSSLQESKRVGSFFFMHVVPQQAGPLPAQHQLVRWIPHKPEKKTEFLPASAVFSLRQVLNQNMSASTHAGDHFMLNVPARHHNKNECVTQTYFSAVSFIHKGSFHLHHVVIIVTVISFFHVIPHLSHHFLSIKVIKFHKKTNTQQGCPCLSSKKEFAK